MTKQIFKRCYGSWREGQERIESCGESFPATSKFFNKNKATSDGLQGMCRNCDNKASRASYQNNLAENRRKRAKWQDDNPELHKEHCRKYQGKPEVKKKNKERREKEKKKRDEFNIDPETALKRLEEFKVNDTKSRRGAYNRKEEEDAKNT